jgi:hypothetical protein
MMIKYALKVTALINVLELPANMDLSAKEDIVSQLIHAQESTVNLDTSVNLVNASNNLAAITTFNVYQDIHANKVNAFQTFMTLNNVVATMTVDMENIARTVNASHKNNAPAMKTAHPENTAKMANADTG